MPKTTRSLRSLECGVCGNSKPELFQEVLVNEMPEIRSSFEDAIGVLEVMALSAFFHGAPEGSSMIREIIDRLKEGSMKADLALAEAYEIASSFDNRCN